MKTRIMIFDLSSECTGYATREKDGNLIGCYHKYTAAFTCLIYIHDHGPPSTRIDGRLLGSFTSSEPASWRKRIQNSNGLSIKRMLLTRLHFAVIAESCLITWLENPRHDCAATSRGAQDRRGRVLFPAGMPPGGLRMVE